MFCVEEKGGGGGVLVEKYAKTHCYSDLYQIWQEFFLSMRSFSSKVDIKATAACDRNEPWLVIKLAITHYLDITFEIF